MLLRHAIGHALRRIRLERGLTLRRLADESRVSLPYLSEIERGRKEVSSEILAVVCEVLDVSLGDLLTSVSEQMNEARAQAIIPVLVVPSSVADESVEVSDAHASQQSLLLAA